MPDAQLFGIKHQASGITNDMERPYDILTFGDLGVDLVLSAADLRPRFGQVEQLVERYELELGGSCCIFACQAARLGLRVAILGRVGADAFGQLALARLAACGVDTRYVVVDPAQTTGLSVALCENDDRAILTYLGTFSALTPDDVSDELLAQARHLHHGSFFLHTGLRPAMPAIFQRARQLGLSISLDPNWDPDERWNSTLAETLALCDICLPNEQEALRIAGEPVLEQAVARLRAQVPMLVLKRGGAGAAVYTANETYTAPVAPAAPGGDSIGAGDSFDAGFLAAWLRGMPLQRCLALANACGRAVAGATGGLNGQLDWAAASAL